MGNSARWIFDMTLTYALAANESHATLYLSGTHVTLYLSGAIVGTLSRPFETRTFQNAIPNGDKWRLTDRNGETVLVTVVRPSKAAMSRALGL